MDSLERLKKIDDKLGAIMAPLFEQVLPAVAPYIADAYNQTNPVKSENEEAHANDVISWAKREAGANELIFVHIWAFCMTLLPADYQG